MAAADLLPLECGAVRLRRLRPGDEPALEAIRADPELGRYQGWSPMGRAAVRRFVAQMQAAPFPWPGEWLQLAIARAGDDLLVGDIGVCVSPDGECAELGFTLAREAQGRGYALAAVGGAIGLLFGHTTVREVNGITDARNLASARLMERAGMQRVAVREAVFRGEACTEWVYSRRRCDDGRSA